MKILHILMLHFPLRRETARTPELVEVDEASSFSLPFAVWTPRRQAVVNIEDSGG